MRKFISMVATVVAATMIIMAVNFVSFGAGDLTDQENASFITRDEFVIWKNAFIASLSQLDLQSTQRIYKDMDFYDMQYRFTDQYKNPYDKNKPEEVDKYNEFEEIINQKIIDEKVRRGLL